MAKFTIQAEETAVFAYEVDAENEDTAREAFFETTSTGSGRMVEAKESSIVSITKRD